ncbi:uncharacterized protein [Diadema setosum]|uniref:uncharacterized protein n=1 Tax=Diadema setosum TaxID=31175 RepID=UPI003B3A4BE2
MPCWYYEKEDLENTPSIKDGIDANTEARYRREGSRFIIEAGTTQGLRYDTMATGVVYFHRFYMFHSFKEFPRYVMGAACLFLAGKVEETPKKCKDIIKIAKNILSEQHFAAFGDDPKEEIMTHERILLQTIKFDLQVEHPYSYLLKYAKTFKGDKDKIQKLVQMAWTFVNDSLCTTLCLQWEPYIVAVGFLYLAGRLSKSDLMDWSGKSTKVKWWEQLNEDVSLDIMEEICHKLLDLYAAGQQKGTPHTPSKAVVKRSKPKSAPEGEGSHGEPSAKAIKHDHPREKQRPPPPPPPVTHAPPTVTPHDRQQSSSVPPPPPQANPSTFPSTSIQVHLGSTSQPPKVPHQGMHLSPRQPPAVQHHHPPVVHQPPQAQQAPPPTSVQQPPQMGHQAPPYHQQPSFPLPKPAPTTFSAPQYNTPPYSSAPSGPGPQVVAPPPVQPSASVPPAAIPTPPASQAQTTPQSYQQLPGPSQFLNHPPPPLLAPSYNRPPPVSTSATQQPNYQQPPHNTSVPPQVQPPVAPQAPMYRPPPPSSIQANVTGLSQNSVPSMPQLPPRPLPPGLPANQYPTSTHPSIPPPTTQYAPPAPPAHPPAVPPHYPIQRTQPAETSTPTTPQTAPPQRMPHNFPPPPGSQVMPNQGTIDQSMLSIAQNYAAQQLQNLGVPRNIAMPPVGGYGNQQQQQHQPQQQQQSQPGAVGPSGQGGFSTGLATVRITGREMGRRPSHGGNKRR